MLNPCFCQHPLQCRNGSRAEDIFVCRECASHADVAAGRTQWGGPSVRKSNPEGWCDMASATGACASGQMPCHATCGMCPPPTKCLHPVASYLGSSGPVRPATWELRLDCSKGQGDTCTKAEPCTPCGVATLPLYGGSKARCGLCSESNTGECHFVEGVGPYCKARPDGKMVAPCTKCCSEPPVWPFAETGGVCV